MKKLIFIIPALLTLPSYADIASNANSATCDSGTIGATSGSTEMEAIWDANSIIINWYNGDTKITTNTCSYDGAVTIPATPTKAGYTFNGWHVRAALPACYTITNQTTCNANSSNGCHWDSYVGCYSTSCYSISNETTCRSNSSCVWKYGCDGTRGSCATFYTGNTRCETLSTYAECDGNHDYIACTWKNNKCEYSVDIGTCGGGGN